MKVILTKYVYKHGVAGDVVNVADGFARNYLIPRELAIKATPGAIRRNQQLIKQAKQNREQLRAEESEAAAKIEGVELVFGVKAGKNSKLYGSVTTRDIADALLAKTGVDINRRRISERPLRELGIHEVPVRISQRENPVLKIVIVREEEVQPYLSGEQVVSLALSASETFFEEDYEPEADVEAAEPAVDEAGEDEEATA